MIRGLVTFQAIVFVCLVPMLEISDTHLFSPDWPPHARLHEAWQLLTNAALSVFVLYLAWRNQRPVSALTISLLVSLSFLAAWGLQSLYGGSMRHADGTQLAIFGLNAAVLLMTFLTGGLLVALASQVMASEWGREK